MYLVHKTLFAHAIYLHICTQYTLYTLFTLNRRLPCVFHFQNGIYIYVSAATNTFSTESCVPVDTYKLFGLSNYLQINSREKMYLYILNASDDELGDVLVTFVVIQSMAIRYDF